MPAEPQRRSKWSWKLGSIFGIDLFLHASFLLLLPWFGVAHYLTDRTLASAVGGVVFILAVFSMVILHELSHALVARRYGIQTKDITLLPIGGVARLDRMPDKPFHELVVALAGPLSNVVIAAVLFVVLRAMHHATWNDMVAPSRAPFLAQLLFVNLSLAVFNMIPAFPMDGGRAVRALLSMWMDPGSATRTAATLGRGIAVFFGITGLMLSAPMLVLIAVFVWFAAGAESAGADMKLALAGLPIRAAMITEFRSLSPYDSLTVAVERLLEGTQHDFPVIDGHLLVGVLTRRDLLHSLGASPYGPATRVGQIMTRELQSADPSDTLEEALERIHDSGCPVLPVVRRGFVIGLLTSENIGELLMVRAALGVPDGAPLAATAITAPEPH
jgi:Zn-dependent protease/CBS domain-containing protein